MNAAARALAQGMVIAGAPTDIRRLSVSKSFVIITLLIIAIVASALAIVTVTDKTRIAFGDLAALQQTRDGLQTRYGQLLLEENTWAAPARVETIAQQNFTMVQPAPRQVIIVKP